MEESHKYTILNLWWNLCLFWHRDWCDSRTSLPACIQGWRSELGINGGEVDMFSRRYENPDWVLREDFVVEGRTHLLLSRQWLEGMALQALWCSRMALSCRYLCSCVFAFWLLPLYSPVLHFYFVYWLKELILSLALGFCIF